MRGFLAGILILLCAAVIAGLFLVGPLAPGRGGQHALKGKVLPKAPGRVVGQVVADHDDSPGVSIDSDDPAPTTPVGGGSVPMGPVVVPQTTLGPESIGGRVSPPVVEPQPSGALSQSPESRGDPGASGSGPSENSVMGVVLDQDLRPVSGAAVTLVAPPGAEQAAAMHRASTDAEGRFAFRAIQTPAAGSGGYTLTVAKEGLPALERSGVRPGDVHVPVRARDGGGDRWQVSYALFTASRSSTTRSGAASASKKYSRR